MVMSNFPFGKTQTTMRVILVVVIVSVSSFWRPAGAQDYELVHYRVIPNVGRHLLPKTDGSGYVLNIWRSTTDNSLFDVGVWDEHLIENHEAVSALVFYSNDFTYQNSVFYGALRSELIGGDMTDQWLLSTPRWFSDVMNTDEFISLPPVENYPSSTFGQYIYLKYDVSDETCEGVLNVAGPFFEIGSSYAGPFPGFITAAHVSAISTWNYQGTVVLGDSLMVSYVMLVGEQSINEEVSYTPYGGQVNLLRLTVNLNTSAYDVQQIGSATGSQTILHVATNHSMDEIYRLGIVRGNDTPISISGAEVTMPPNDSLYHVFITKESVDGYTDWVTELFAYNNLYPDSVATSPWETFFVYFETNSITNRNDMLFVNSSITSMAPLGDSILYRDFTGQEYMFAEYRPWVQDNSPRHYAFAESRIFKLDIHGEILGKLATVFPNGHYEGMGYRQPSKLIEVGDRLAWLQKYASDNDTIASIVYSETDGSQQTFEISLPAGEGTVIVWLDDLLNVVDYWIMPIETTSPWGGNFYISSILPYQEDTLVMQGMINTVTTTDLNPFADSEMISVDVPSTFFAFYSVPGFLTKTKTESRQVSFNIYPNPSSKSIMVRGENLERAEYVVHDLAGRVLKRGFSAPVFPIDVSDLAGGVYLLSLQTKWGSGTRRFVVW